MHFHALCRAVTCHHVITSYEANHPTTLFYLADTGLQYCRLICADVLPPCKGKTFNQLAEDIYVLLQKKLLKENESRRFEKAWLGRGAIAFYNQLGKSPRHNLYQHVLSSHFFLHRFSFVNT